VRGEKRIGRENKKGRDSERRGRDREEREKR
jgi:hypothetical protein